jgi:lysophospholipase L1-like esterase
MTVTLLDVEGNVMAIEYCDYNGWINTYKEPKFEKDNDKYYRFLGWFDQNTDEQFDFNKKVVKSCILEPRYDIYDIEETTLDNATISFMGDSISTFYDGSNNPQSYYGGTNQYYYPLYSATVKSYTQTWWYQTYNSLGLKLGVNNSWSGSAAFGHSSSAGSSTSRLETLGENGTPNIVVIYLGTNDNVNGHKVENLHQAYVTMIDYITTNYVTFEGTIAKIPYIYLFTNGYSAYSGYNYTEERRLQYNELFKQLANEYQNVRVFDLANIITKDNYSLYLGDSLHYNATGMTFIATNFVKQLKEEGWTLLSLEQTTNSVMLDELKLEKNTKIAIVLGNEVDGVEQEVIDLCHQSVEIPQFGTKHSFNVSVSAGIFLWQLYCLIK